MEGPHRSAVLVVARTGNTGFCAALAGQKWEIRSCPADAPLSSLRELVDRKPALIAAVVDGGAANPVQLARQIQAGAPLAQLIFVAGCEDESRLHSALRASPLVGAHWGMLAADHPDLERQLLDEIAIGGHRARYRTTLNKVTLRLSANEPMEAQTFHRLVISEKFLAAIVENSPESIVTLSLQREILSWNASSEQLWGCSSAAAMARRFEEFLDPGSRAPFLASIQRVAAERVSLRLESNALRSNGTQLPVEMTVSPVSDEERNVIAFSVSAHDISEHKEFLRAQRIESIGTLASGMAHNLNNMLTPIVMGAGMLKQLEERPENLEIIATMAQSAERAAELVSQVLLFGRGVERTPLTVRFAAVIRDVAAMVANTFPKNIVFATQPASDLWPVTGNHTQLVQVLLNLCVNARDAMPSGGRLSIVARNIDVGPDVAKSRGSAAGRYIVVEVTDTGCGMHPEIIGRIFEPFFTTKPVGKGTGLGLSTALGIVRSHRGFVDVASEVGRGSCFRVHLPAESESVGGENAQSPARTLLRANGELILVVDDEALMLSITKRTLETFGYEVIAAEGGAEALRLYERHRAKIAVVLTDMMMPGMDGPAFIAALRRTAATLPIIAVSGIGDGENVAKARAAGVNHFLAKPYSAETVLRLVESVLAERPSWTPPPRNEEQSPRASS
ncbi:MAG TPA: response regulator [Opitutaceae bacterium]|nr:response regulator [Opitutaceae bacterium]